jgi:hypothetical protein
VPEQALQYLRKLCSHPLLVLDAAVAQHVAAAAAVANTAPGQWDKTGSALRQLRHAPKLAALLELLQVCFSPLKSGHTSVCEQVYLLANALWSRHEW